MGCSASIIREGLSPDNLFNLSSKNSNIRKKVSDVQDEEPSIHEKSKHGSRCAMAMLSESSKGSDSPMDLTKSKSGAVDAVSPRSHPGTGSLRMNSLGTCGWNSAVLLTTEPRNPTTASPDGANVALRNQDAVKTIVIVPQGDVRSNSGSRGSSLSGYLEFRTVFSRSESKADDLSASANEANANANANGGADLAQAVPPPAADFSGFPTIGKHYDVFEVLALREEEKENPPNRTAAWGTSPSHPDLKDKGGPGEKRSPLPSTTLMGAVDDDVDDDDALAHTRFAGASTSQAFGGRDVSSGSATTASPQNSYPSLHPAKVSEEYGVEGRAPLQAEEARRMGLAATRDTDRIVMFGKGGDSLCDGGGDDNDNFSDDFDDIDVDDGNGGLSFALDHWKRFYHYNRHKQGDLLKFFWNKLDSSGAAGPSLCLVTYAYEHLLTAAFQPLNASHGFCCRVEEAILQGKTSDCLQGHQHPTPSAPSHASKGTRPSRSSSLLRGQVFGVFVTFYVFDGGSGDDDDRAGSGGSFRDARHPGMPFRSVLRAPSVDKPSDPISGSGPLASEDAFRLLGLLLMDGADTLSQVKSLGGMEYFDFHPCDAASLQNGHVRSLVSALLTRQAPVRGWQMLHSRELL